MTAYPNDFGWVMPKRGVILLTVHYAPDQKMQKVFAGVNLFFKNTPVKRNVKIISFGSAVVLANRKFLLTFYIPANKTKTLQLDVTNPGEDFSIMYVWPHMHYIGK